MRVAIIGSHSTGKTTLAIEVGQTTDFEYVRSDSVRDSAGQGSHGKRLNEFDDDEGMQIQSDYLDEVTQAVEANGNVITDCSPISSGPYSDRLLSSEARTTEEYRSIQERAARLTGMIDLHLYLPPEAPLVDDGFRPVSPSMRYEIGRDILDQLKGLPFYVLLGCLRRRLETTQKILEGTKGVYENFIAFEGLPGSGKSTQLRKLEENLQTRGVDAYFCQRYPSDRVRAKLNSLYENPIGNRDQLLELHRTSFLEQYERNQVEERLARGQLVFSDRQKFTVIAMQMALGNDINHVYEALGDLPGPGRVMLLDTDSDVCVTRTLKRGEVHNLKSDPDFQRKVAEAYRWLAAHHIEFEVVNGNSTPELVGKNILRVLGFDHSLGIAAENVKGLMEAYPCTGTKQWGHTQIVQDLSYQVGNLHKAIMQLGGYVHMDGMTIEEINASIALDIGDMLYLTLYLTTLSRIDPDQALQKELASDVQKIKDRSRTNRGV